MILSFQGYSFCKPHSASYALVSFKACYLRAHFPAEFMAAVISNQGGYYTTMAYLSEARRMGLTILPPDVNASAVPYTGNGRNLRVGLMQLQGVRQASLEALLEDQRTARNEASRRRPDLKPLLNRRQDLLVGSAPHLLQHCERRGGGRGVQVARKKRCRF